MNTLPDDFSARQVYEGMDQEIDREVLRLLEQLQKEIDTFRGIRHLWAETVANRRDNGLSAEEMMKRQRERLWSIGGAAMNLQAYAFPGRSPHARFRWQEKQEENREWEDEG